MSKKEKKYRTGNYQDADGWMAGKELRFSIITSSNHRLKSAFER